MKIVVFGATGPSGRAVVERALAVGHEVRGFVRNPVALGDLASRIECVRGDVLDAAAVRAAVESCNAVVSALGQGRSNKPTTTMSDGARNVVAAMKATGVDRGIFISSLGACDDPNEPFLFRTVGRWLYGNIFADHRRMEQEIRASEGRWTIVRPGSLSNGASTERYRIARDNRAPGANSISRADVAHFVLGDLSAAHHVRVAVALGY